jgi:hypothetical protein
VYYFLSLDKKKAPYDHHLTSYTQEWVITNNDSYRNDI